MNIRCPMGRDQSAIGERQRRYNELLRAALVGCAASILVWAYHTLLYRGWIVDDAAISFAFARNLATGNGLVPQIHAPAVEGYSNPLWVFICAVPYALGIFEIPLTPKALSVFFLAIGFGIVYRLLTSYGHCPRSLSLASVFSAALQPSLMIWALSGLENGLLAAVLASLSLGCVRLGVCGVSRAVCATTGLIAAACTLTRPETIVFAAIPLICLSSSRPTVPTSRGRAISVYLVAFLAPLIAYEAFRIIYFGDVLPNVYYAKGGPTLPRTMAILFAAPDILKRALSLVSSCTGYYLTTPALVGGILLFWRSRWRGATSIPGRILLVFTLVSVISYLLLPEDWMPEARFATPFFLFVYPCAATLVADYVRAAGIRRIAQVVIPCLAAGMVLTTLAVGIPRAIRFARNPTIPVEEVLAISKRIEKYGRIVNKDRPSVLTADIGGLLLRDRVEVVDLGMLCDRTIARAVGDAHWPRSRSSLYNYVLHERRPDFIRLRAYHAWLAQLDRDERFRAEYAPIVEYEDQWVLRRYGESICSGDFVRRDLLSSADLLTALRRVAKHGAFFGRAGNGERAGGCRCPSVGF